MWKIVGDARAILADKEIESAAERIGEESARILTMSAKFRIGQRDAAVVCPDTITRLEA